VHAAAAAPATADGPAQNSQALGSRARRSSADGVASAEAGLALKLLVGLNLSDTNGIIARYTVIFLGFAIAVVVLAAAYVIGVRRAARVREDFTKMTLAAWQVSGQRRPFVLLMVTRRALRRRSLRRRRESCLQTADASRVTRVRLKRPSAWFRQLSWVISLLADRDLILPRSGRLDVLPGIRLSCLARAGARSVRRYARTGEWSGAGG